MNYNDNTLVCLHSHVRISVLKYCLFVVDVPSCTYTTVQASYFSAYSRFSVSTPGKLLNKLYRRLHYILL